jgi:hypothetical protein
VRARRNRGEDRGRCWTRWKRITPTVPHDPGLGGETSRRREGSGGGQWVRARAQGEAGPRAATARHVTVRVLAILDIFC